MSVRPSVCPSLFLSVSIYVCLPAYLKACMCLCDGRTDIYIRMDGPANQTAKQTDSQLKVHTDRRTDIGQDWRTYGWMDVKAYIHTDRRTDRQKDKHTYKHTVRQTNRRVDGQTDGRKHVWTDIQRCRQTNRQTCIYTAIHSFVHSYNSEIATRK